jgi:integrase
MVINMKRHSENTPIRDCCSRLYYSQLDTSQGWRLHKTRNCSSTSRMSESHPRRTNRHSRRTLGLKPDSKTVTGIRDVPLSDRAIAILRRRCGDRREGWVFPSKRAKSGHPTTTAVKFRQARKKAGLSEDLVLYCGRHDFGTRVL